MSNLNERLNSLKNETVEQRPKRKFNVAVVATIIIMIILAVVVYIIIENSPEEAKKIEENKKIIDELDETSSTRDKDPSREDSSTENDLAELWKKIGYTKQSEEMVARMLKDTEGNGVNNAFSDFPSESEGFTSDPSKHYDENGVPNIYYVPFAQNDLTAQVTTIMYRLSNSRFGEWGKTKEALNKPYSYFVRDICSDEFAEQLEANKTELLLLDYNNDGYGGKLEPNSFVYIEAEPKNIEVSVVGDVIKLKFTNEYKINNKSTEFKKSFDLELTYKDNQVKIVKGIVQ